jgi:hypothetical protein
VSAVVFLEIVKSGPRADEVVRSVREQTPSVAYAEHSGTDRIEVFFSAADVDDEQARAALERALDASGTDARDHVRVVYPS